MPPHAGILSMFARSPIRPLQLHMKKAQNCAELLLPYFDTVLLKDWEKAADLRQQISTSEREADTLKLDFRLNLPKSLFLPFSRLFLRLLSCLSHTMLSNINTRTRTRIKTKIRIRIKTRIKIELGLGLELGLKLRHSQHTQAATDLLSRIG